MFHISSQKRNEKKEHISVNQKQEKNVKKVYVNINHSVHWGINPPQKHHHPLSCQAPPLNQQTD